MGIPMVSGRIFAPSDDGTAEPVTIINRAMANRYWPNQNPIDRRVRLSGRSSGQPWFRIVGVVENVRHISLSREPAAEMYRPYSQTGLGAFTVVVKTAVEPTTIGRAARDAIRSIDPNLPVYDMRTMEERISGSFAQTRGTMLLLLATALLAAALSGVAIYGSIWYSVSRRIPEIGVRLALGASRSSVFADVLRRAAVLAAVGASIGVVGALAGSQLLAGLLYETSATDPRTLAIVLAATFALALAAGVVPARRAMRVDPMTALRNE
jgi:putative ABC transport system permease protein